MSVDARSPAYQVLADELREQITSGRLRLGDRLPTEPELCQTSGVSRSTVREALRLLASQNLIVTTRGVSGGSFVVHPTPAQISEGIQTGVALLKASSLVSPAELLEARAIVEVPVAGLAARRRSDDQLAALRATLFDPRTAEVETMVAVHHLFHRALAAACGNPLLELIAHPLQAVSSAMRLPETLDRDNWIRVDADHRAIFDAVHRRDQGSAEAAAAAHLEYLGAIMPREQLPPPVVVQPAVVGAAAGAGARPSGAPSGARAPFAPAISPPAGHPPATSPAANRTAVDNPAQAVNPAPAVNPASAPNPGPAPAAKPAQPVNPAAVDNPAQAGNPAAVDNEVPVNSPAPPDNEARADNSATDGPAPADDPAAPATSPHATTQPAGSAAAVAPPAGAIAAVDASAD